MKAIFTVRNTTEVVVKRRPEKKFRPVRDLNHDLCDTGAVLYQATRELVTVLVSNKPVK